MKQLTRNNRKLMTCQQTEGRKGVQSPACPWNTLPPFYSSSAGEVEPPSIPTNTLYSHTPNKDIPNANEGNVDSVYYDTDNDLDAEGGKATGEDVDIGGKGYGEVEGSNEEISGYRLQFYHTISLYAKANRKTY